MPSVDRETYARGATSTDAIRVGIGHDTHRLRPGGPLRLGGIDIPHDRELIGHSDGDVLLHAVIDALLGAAALGDIGQMFPDTDPANRGRDSAEMLVAAHAAVTAVGWQIGNLDCIVFAQRPKLLPHRQSMRERLADILQIDAERVSLKGKTGEHVGPVGLEEIIEAQCVALLTAK
jgi:2-C-methyl-D-erythritol 2,4-cyclodiphosphate synthase